ncbi:MAG: MFS transporter [Actinobacteria bacterium]|nr:MAG: MFS transporter [Actinomycetota bacterium]
MQALRRQLVDSLRAFSNIYRNPRLRRLQLAWIGSSVGTWGYVIALMVYAYRQGGPAGVGLVGLIRWFPAAVAAPFGGMIGDRFPRLRVMVVSDLVRAGALAAAAGAIVLDTPAVSVYLLAVLVMLVSQAFQPAESALLPTLAESPEELAAANVANSTIEAAGYFVGPALGGVLLAVSNVETVFVMTAVAFLWSAAMLALIRLPEPEPGGEAARGSWQHEALAGFRTIWRDSRLRLIIALFAAQTLVYGGFVVLTAVASIRLLGLGSPGIGYLNAALGVGGLIGGIVAVALVGIRRLAFTFGLALVLWGGPILVIGLWAKAAPAFVLIGLAGLGLTLVDVAGFTLLQRAVPEEVLARVFGVLHSAFYVTGGIGSILAPALISWLGIRGALIVAGAVLPAVTIPSFGMLARIDRTLTVPTAQLKALRAIEMFAPLPAPTLEALASSLTRVSVPAGESVFRQGDHGDRFYIVDSGEIEIEIDGREANVLGPGDHFGEIALLRDIPRTATARARKETQLYALDRNAFLGAVTGHASSSEAAETVVVARLGLTG